MGVDHDLVPLPPSVPVNLASLPGFDKHVRDLGPTGAEGECASPSPVESLGSPTNVDSISELMDGLCLHANEAWALGAFSPMVSTTQGWSVSLTPSWGHDHPRKISIASIPSLTRPCHGSQGNHYFP
jgi:hypothetical protein